MYSILILGDGDFSFSLAVARMLFVGKKSDDSVDIAVCEDDGQSVHTSTEVGQEQVARAMLGIPDCISASDIRIITTSFESYEQLEPKYPGFKSIMHGLSMYAEVRVLHEVNAWQLEEQFTGQKFHTILWNHPHLGVEDFRLHRFLLAHFFRSAANMLLDSNEPYNGDRIDENVDTSRHQPAVVVTLLRGQEIRWDIAAQAMRPGTDLSLSRCTKFHDEDFPGYVCKRNKNGQTFKNVRTRKHVGIDMSSFCYTFSRGDNSLISVPSTSLVDTSHIAETDEGATDAAVTPTLSRYATEKLSCEDALPQCFAKGDSSTLTHGSQPVSEVESADATITSPFLSSTDIVREALEVADAHASTTRPGDNQGKPASTKGKGTDHLKLAAPIQCKHCPRSFDSKRGLKTHTHQVHKLNKYGNAWEAAKAKALQCAHCHRNYHDREALWQHVVSKHSHDGDIAVPQGPLTEAERELDGKEVEFYPCAVCGQAVPAHWHLDQHLEMLKPLCGMVAECKVCHRTFIEHRALRQHLNFCRLKSADGAESAATIDATVMATLATATDGSTAEMSSEMLFSLAPI